MSVKNRGTGEIPRWHYRFMIDGVPYSGAIPDVDNEKDAKDYEKKKRAEVVLGLYDKTEPGDHNFCEFVDDVYLVYSRENKESWKHDEFRCAILKKHFEGKRFCDITPMVITGYINTRLKSKTVRKESLEDGSKLNRQRSPTTVRKEVNLLSSIFNLAIDEEVAVKNPCRRLPKSVLSKIPVRNKRERFLTLEEERRLFEIGLTGPREHIRPIVELGINTGVRRGGILGISKEHINLGTKSVFCTIEVKGVRKSYEIKQNHMFVVRNKGNKPYTVPLNAAARRVMEELLADDELTGYLFLNEMTGRSLTEIKRSFKTACRLAGIEDFTFHDLRHTFTTRLKEAGVDKISRRDLLGHSTTEMTDDYTHSYDETLQKAVDALPQRAQCDLHKICTKEEKQVSLQLVSGRK